MDDGQVMQALSDRDAVALTLWGEARGEPIDGLVGVANVIRNRFARARSRTWKQVVHKPAQFSCWSPAGGDAERANYTRVIGAARVLVSGSPLEAPGLERCAIVADLVIADALRDTVAGARHYCTVALFKSAPPAWAKGREPDVVLGAQAFFAGVA